MLKVRDDLALNGNIDGVSPDGVVSGWCWSPDEPGIRRVVCLAIDGLDIAETIAGQLRADLAAAGVGDGGHGFVVQLAPADIPERAASVLTLRDVATGRMIGGELTVAWERPGSEAEAAPVLVGNLEQASQEGWVSGWAWYPDAPQRRVSLDILVDDLLVGSTRATLFRPDLQAAGIGDGTYGFSFALPWSVMSSKGEMALSVRDAATGRGFGDPVVLRIGRLVEVEERINGLERQVRLLAARLSEHERAVDPAREAAAAKALFRTVAAFFRDLAAVPDPAEPAGTLLRHAIGTVFDTHAPIALAVPAQPAATLLLGGDAPRPALYAALQALVEAGADRLADIVLLDDGRHGADVALLPAIVGNLRYVRLAAGEDAAMAATRIAAEGRGDVLVMMSPHLRPSHDLMALLLSALGGAPGLAAAMVLRADGSIAHAGYSMDIAEGLTDKLAGGEPAPPAEARRQAVDAVADLCFAVSRSALHEVGGFPAGYATSAASVAGLCFALRRAEHQVVLQPAARAVLVDGVERPRPLPMDDADRLRDRWAAGRL